jgi:hypothetical protein
MEEFTSESNSSEAAGALIRAADACSRSGRLLEAADLLEQALAIDPGSPEIRFKLAHIRVNRPRAVGDLDVSRRMVGELLATDPDAFRYRCLAASAASNLGIEEEFWRHYEAALALTSTEDVSG